MIAATLNPRSKPDFFARLTNLTADTRNSGPSAELLADSQRLIA